MEDEDAFLARHRAEYTRRMADIAAMPNIGYVRQVSEPPPPLQPPLQDLLSPQPKWQRTEEQERIRRRGMAMLELENALAAEEAAAEQTRANAAKDFRANTAIGRLLR